MHSNGCLRWWEKELRLVTQISNSPFTSQGLLVVRRPHRCELRAVAPTNLAHWTFSSELCRTLSVISFVLVRAF